MAHAFSRPPTPYCAVNSRSALGHFFASGDEAIQVRSAPHTTDSAFTPGIGVIADAILLASIGTNLANKRLSLVYNNDANLAHCDAEGPPCNGSPLQGDYGFWLFANVRTVATDSFRLFATSCKFRPEEIAARMTAR